MEGTLSLEEKATFAAGARWAVTALAMALVEAKLLTPDAIEDAFDAVSGVIMEHGPDLEANHVNVIGGVFASLGADYSRDKALNKVRLSLLHAPISEPYEED